MEPEGDKLHLASVLSLSMLQSSHCPLSHESPTPTVTFMLDNATPQDLCPVSMFSSHAARIVRPIYIVRHGRKAKVWGVRYRTFDFHAGHQRAFVFTHICHKYFPYLKHTVVAMQLLYKSMDLKKKCLL